jgi:light-regulated signal transduction histidine kinase (bacteriophytochrome)
MINDLLAFSRVTVQAKSLTAIDLNQIVNNVVSDLQLLIEQSGGRVEIGELPTVDSDSTQMYQLMSNLIKNALKFRKQGIAPLVKTYSKLIGNQCQIFVEDNGIGFDEKYSERIFQLFQRLHGRGEYEGTGLGLAICQKIAKCHGGDISARSEPGKGQA